MATTLAGFRSLPLRFVTCNLRDGHYASLCYSARKVALEWARLRRLVETVRNYLKKRYARNPRLCGTSGSREFRLFLNLAQTHVSMSKQLKDCDIETVCVWFCWQLFQVNQLFASINIDVSQAAASTHFEPSCQG